MGFREMGKWGEGKNVEQNKAYFFIFLWIFENFSN